MDQSLSRDRRAGHVRSPPTTMCRGRVRRHTPKDSRRTRTFDTGPRRESPSAPPSTTCLPGAPISISFVPATRRIDTTAPLTDGGDLTADLTLGGAAFLMLSLNLTYAGLIAFAVVAGLANSVYHPADYAILSAGIPETRIGKALEFLSALRSIAD